MNRLFLTLLGGLFFNTFVFAQLELPSLQGEAVQTITNEGFVAFAPRVYPLDTAIRVENTETGKEIEVTVIGRYTQSAGRIVDLSPSAWEALELKPTTIVRLYAPLSAPSESKEKEPIFIREPVIIKEPVIIREPVIMKEEIPSPQFTQPLYHLLVLDRISCDLNSEIGDFEKVAVLYQYNHGANGYIIILYTAFTKDSVISAIPDKARIITNISTVNRAAMREYINSNSFKRFVSNKNILPEIKAAIKDIKIIPALPKANSNTLYCLQVGAFSEPERTAEAVRLLKLMDLEAVVEQHGSLERVFAADIPAADVYSTTRRIEFAGFKEVWIRE